MIKSDHISHSINHQINQSALLNFKAETPSAKGCLTEYHYLKLLSVLKVGGLEVLFANNFDDRVFQLLLEGKVLARRVQVIHQLLPSTGNMSRKEMLLIVLWL